MLYASRGCDEYQPFAISRLDRLRGNDLAVNISPKFQCMLGNKTRQLQVEVSAEIELAAFKKDTNGGIVYLIPTNWAAFSHPAPNSIKGLS